jgi:5'-deoxynucleotidase YfbR-like HD superfamily hydrolase
MSPHTTTASGLRLNALAATPADIRIEDIAHHLGAVNRFNGATRVPYSVAQHSVLVSRQLEEHGPAVALLGLLHDGSEAYLCDIPAPLKHSETFAAYREAERTLQAVIYATFGLEVYAQDPTAAALVAHADRRMLRTEQEQLMPPAGPGDAFVGVSPYPLILSPWSAANARAWFLDRFRALRKRLTAAEGGVA